MFSFFLSVEMPRVGGVVTRRCPVCRALKHHRARHLRNQHLPRGLFCSRVPLEERCILWDRLLSVIMSGLGVTAMRDLCNMIGDRGLTAGVVVCEGRDFGEVARIGGWGEEFHRVRPLGSELVLGRLIALLPREDQLMISGMGREVGSHRSQTRGIVGVPSGVACRQDPPSEDRYRQADAPLGFEYDRGSVLAGDVVVTVGDCERRVNLTTDQESLQSLWWGVTVDTHCHLLRMFNKMKVTNWWEFRTGSGSPDPVMICNMVTPRELQTLPEFRLRCPGTTRFSVGLHPVELHGERAWWPVVERLAAAPYVVAIGETGLDRLSEYPLRRRGQEDLFRRHVHLAHRCQKALIIHCRDADPRDVSRILSEEAPEHQHIQWHCAGNLPRGMMRRLLARFPNLYLSVGTTLLGARGAEEAWGLEDLVGEWPQDRVVLETDAPFLGTPPDTPYLLQLKAILDYLANKMRRPGEEVQELTARNAAKLFGL